MKDNFYKYEGIILGLMTLLSASFLGASNDAYTSALDTTRYCLLLEDRMCGDDN